MRVRVAIFLVFALVAAVGGMIWKLDGADDQRAHQTPGHAAGVARPHLVRRRLAHAAPLDLYADEGMISAVARRA